MAVSIIDVQVNDDAFKRFQDLFNAYREQLKELPGEWGKVEATTAETGATYAGMTAALLAQNEMLHEKEQAEKRMDEARAKANKAQAEAEKRQLDLERKRRVEVAAIWGDTKRIAGSVASTTSDLFRWVGVGTILSGLIGAGGLWGLDALADRVGGARRAAGGVGVSTGQLQAAQINFQRYVDVPSSLENVANAQNDLGKGWAFGALGLNRNQDPATLLGQLLVKAKGLFDSGHTFQQDPMVRALAVMGISLDDMRRLHRISMTELRGAEAGYGRDRNTLGFTDKVAKQWQDLSVVLEHSKLTIESALVTALAPLAPQIVQLSKAIAEGIRTFLTSPRLKEWIKDFGAGIKVVADYLGSDNFQSDIKKFVDYTHKFVDGFGQLVDWTYQKLKDMGIIQPTPMDAATRWSNTPIYDLNHGGFLPRAMQGHNIWESPGDVAAQVAAQRGDRGAGEAVGGGSRRALNTAGWFRNFGGWNPNQAAGIAANLQSESGLNPFSKGDVVNGRPTAYGIAQWHAHRQAEYTRLYGHTMQSVTDMHTALIEQLRFVQYELTRGEYKKIGQRLKDLDNPTAFHAGAFLSENYEAPKDKVGEAVRRGGQAQVIVTIMNQTGAHVAVNGSQLPQ